MATIGSFFAEVGFKVNAGQLKTVNSTLKQINSAYKSLTTEIKKQGLELKNQLAAEKIATQEKKTAAQASKAKEAQLKAETAEIKKNIAEINLQNKSLKNQSNTFNSLAQNYSRIKNGMTSVFKGATIGIRENFNRLERWTTQTRQTALEYRDFARQTGMPIEGLQKYQAAGENVGSSLTSSQIAQDIKNLQQRAQQIVYGQGDVSPYQMLGIVPNKRDAYEVLEGLRNRIEGLSDSAALMWIRNIGLSDDWLHILRMSTEEFNSIEKVMLSQNQIRKTTQLAMSFRQIQFALKQLKDQMVAFIAEPVSNFISNFKTMTLDLAAFIKSMATSKEAFQIFATGLGLIVLAFSPVIAALGALLLLWEDFYVGTHGGESLFNWNPEDFEKFKTTLIEGFKEIKEQAQTIGKTVREMFGWVWDLVEKLGKWLGDKAYKKEVIETSIENENKRRAKEGIPPLTPEEEYRIYQETGTVGAKERIKAINAGINPLTGEKHTSWMDTFKDWVNNATGGLFIKKGYTPIGENLYTPTGFTPSGAPITINDNKTINKTYNVKDTDGLIKLENNENSAPWDEAVYVTADAWAAANFDHSQEQNIKAQKAMQGGN